jgi:hypothetical protein
VGIHYAAISVSGCAICSGASRTSVSRRNVNLGMQSQVLAQSPSSYYNDSSAELKQRSEIGSGTQALATSFSRSGLTALINGSSDAEISSLRVR